MEDGTNPLVVDLKAKLEASGISTERYGINIDNWRRKESEGQTPCGRRHTQPTKLVSNIGEDEAC